MAKIVIADDEADIVELLSLVLTDFGYTVLTAANGLEAWKLIEQEQPQLVISDVMMPVMTGIQLLLQIKSKPEPIFKGIKIVLISAAPISITEPQADAYLSKPFDVDNVETIINDLLKLSSDPPVSSKQVYA